LDYLCGKQNRASDLVKQIEREVQKTLDNEEWRVEYMTLLMRDQENQEIGMAMQLIKSVESVQRKFSLTLEEACEATESTLEEYEEAKELIASLDNE
jgi:hypothetical protein